MKTPAKKRTAAELAAAVLWCALTLGTDRLFFRYDWRTPAFFVYKALFLVLAFGLVHGAVTLVQKLRAGDKFARRWVTWTLPYLAVNLVILLIVWPGIWGNDDLAVLYLARTLQPNSWQHFLTSGAFILSLMFVPMPGGVVLVQNLLISGIVGCFAATAQDLAEKRLTRPVRPAWFALVYPAVFAAARADAHPAALPHDLVTVDRAVFGIHAGGHVSARHEAEQKGAGRYRDSGHAGCVVAQRVRLLSGRHPGAAGAAPAAVDRAYQAHSRPAHIGAGRKIKNPRHGSCKPWRGAFWGYSMQIRLFSGSFFCPAFGTSSVRIPFSNLADTSSGFTSPT